MENAQKITESAIFDLAIRSSGISRSEFVQEIRRIQLDSMRSGAWLAAQATHIIKESTASALGRYKCDECAEIILQVARQWTIAALEQMDYTLKLSNCCSKPIKPHSGDEGTCFYVCCHCGNACDPLVF